MIGYWNPLPTARRVLKDLGERPEELFTGRWEQRNWRNVPGPFYAGETDSMATGRLDAPDHIAYDDDLGGSFGFEFVYRQPVDEDETAALIHGSQLELCRGYNWDGDDHWTTESVRDWWRERARVQEWAAAIAADWGADTHPHWGFNADPRYLGHYHDAARGHRDFLAYIDGGLAPYLRGYLFWLDQRREPRAGETLPRL
ncbi:ferredoxin [Streptomyces sp. NPDC048330]|uniref:ferredoxin n=1 Tax=Streptomyces sp. NPDC048330 TaxID=3365533 RepID=UPI0037193DF2